MVAVVAAAVAWVGRWFQHVVICCHFFGRMMPATKLQINGRPAASDWFESQILPVSSCAVLPRSLRGQRTRGELLHPYFECRCSSLWLALWPKHRVAMSVGEQVCCCLKWKQLKQPHSRDSLSGENLSMFQIGQSTCARFPACEIRECHGNTELYQCAGSRSTVRSVRLSMEVWHVAEIFRVQSKESFWFEFRRTWPRPQPQPPLPHLLLLCSGPGTEWIDSKPVTIDVLGTS